MSLFERFGLGPGVNDDEISLFCITSSQKSNEPEYAFVWGWLYISNDVFIFDPFGSVIIAIILFLYKYYVTFISVIFDPLYVKVYNLLIPSDPVTATDVGPSLPYAILVIC